VVSWTSWRWVRLRQDGDIVLDLTFTCRHQPFASGSLDNCSFESSQTLAIAAERKRKAAGILRGSVADILLFPGSVGFLRHCHQNDESIGCLACSIMATRKKDLACLLWSISSSGI
jgi:hypothetical protein